MYWSETVHLIYGFVFEIRNFTKGVSIEADIVSSAK